MSFMPSVAVCAPRIRDFCALSWKSSRETQNAPQSHLEPIRAKSPDALTGVPGLFLCFRRSLWAKENARAAAPKPHQKYTSLDRCTWCGAPAWHSQTGTKPGQKCDKTATKVRQKTRPCRCLSVSKPCQKWGKNPRLRVVTVCQNRDKSATRIRGCVLSRAVFLVKAFQQESGHFRVIAIILP